MGVQCPPNTGTSAERTSKTPGLYKKKAGGFRANVQDLWGKKWPAEIQRAGIPQIEEDLHPKSTWERKDHNQEGKRDLSRTLTVLVKGISPKNGGQEEHVERARTRGISDVGRT